MIAFYSTHSVKHCVEIARACNPENRSRDPGIHFKSQSQHLKVIGISGLKIVIFGQILAHFWSFLAKFWLVVKLFSPNYVQYSDLVLELYENLQFMNFWTF